MGRATVRLSVNISEETADQLRQLAEKKGTTVTNILRRAVGTKFFLDKELRGHPEKSLVIRNDQEKTLTTLELL